MDGWRDQGVNFNPEATRTRPYTYRKPPIGGNPNPNWQQSVPSWEKKFCSSVGSVPWKKLVETKRFFHLYDNVIKWNDSAGKEAFQNAKNKFYANMHGLPYDKWHPDPDIYIDKIDWNSEVDPNLILDLESDSVVPDSSCQDEQVVIFGSNFPPSYQNFSPYGWGDSDDDDKKKDPSPENTWGDVDNNINNNWWGWNGNGNENENEKKGEGDNRGWGEKDSRYDYWGWNVYDDNNYFYGDVNNKMKEGNGNGNGNGRYMSRYKRSRFRGDDNQRNQNQSRRNNGNARKQGYTCAQTPGGNAHRWSVKKSVS